MHLALLYAGEVGGMDSRALGHGTLGNSVALSSRHDSLANVLS